VSIEFVVAGGKELHRSGDADPHTRLMTPELLEAPMLIPQLLDHMLERPARACGQVCADQVCAHQADSQLQTACMSAQRCPSALPSDPRARPAILDSKSTTSAFAAAVSLICRRSGRVVSDP
jgi:hypothetical protein